MLARVELSDDERVQLREEALRRTIESLGDSVSILAHEIKNPKTAVHLALCAVASRLGEDEKAVLEDLVARLDRLELRLRRALNLTGALEVASDRCDAAELLGAVANGVSGAAVDVAPGCPEVAGDAALLTEALGALVDNAARAGSVKVRAGAGGAGRVRLEVDDDGPGIPEALKDTAFQPFFTTDDERSGLGLAIAKRIVEAHGGTIGLGDAPGGGTRAWVELPSA